ncbi:preprotein translocase subunit SecY [Idiomarina loihiensis]|jgi:preprotein translocase subunit SecY|uniref:Protein translocase subunit SecY n=1 Tax=Idiomarina loihiensis (strain ATCC BAA-735 / DSM 15497 / L2-TR) TaxID=283942 RepID=Q5QXV3_IDILO|nr:MULTISPECIES: preprotein translocase subunit SecY [Idiomarina]MAA62892.1 preprotein translocase subunit SecY [Idiomarina sp.]AAV82728.1 Preprotein translocase subunit SecY [Idiomarina loihiensis L2TR]AGM36770.1 preprotein translocase subunit SecY [Idiomarina loihiensis GSL 199]MBL4855321.1 preprotein translocase subunit SecY [Idiomarina sp.]MRJ44656.1 preprotein translocase subunit SecY [Idiomarina loihiensis]|tara:strand:+ start:68322 stop:69650 length:1329 start_codon:yes stop_codon:yes gene_type:complete
MAKPGLESNRAQGGLSELKRRLLFVLGAIIVFRAGSFVPIPGIDAAVLAQLFEQQKDTIVAMFNMFSGGALERASVFALGIMPYISASIIMQLASVVHPRLAELKKEGESGRRKINQYTRWGTLILATFQSIGIATGLPNLMPGLVIDPGFGFYFTAVVSLVTGTMFLMWLGEQITERGIGNGISILIFVGIVAGLPSAIGQTAEQARQGDLHLLLLLLIGVVVLAVTYFVVFVERGQRRIVVNYAKRQQGRKVFAAQSTHLPLKVNMAGVIPPIFASSIILFPGTIATWFGSGEGMVADFLQQVSMTLSPGQPLYVLLYAAAIIFFCFFYTALVFNPRETADNLKKSGAFIPGIRPGEQTSRYIDKVMTRLTLAGALYITFVCLVPEFMMIAWNVQFYFGGTSLLIIVVVIMDFMAQVQTHMMSHQYDSVLKKANLKGYGR